MTHPWPYLVAGAVLLVLAAARRRPVIGRLLSGALFLACALVLVSAVDQMTALDPRLARVAGLLRLERQDVVGRDMRIAMSPDGHFWVRATIDGHERRLLVDSGATVTTLSTQTAAAVGLDPHGGMFPVLLATANGMIAAPTATVAEVRLGNIVARDLTVLVAPSTRGMDMVGMNFLSRLQGWRVEGRTLVLVPHHLQGAHSS